MVVLLLKEKLLGGQVGTKCNDSNAESGSGALESVSSGEVCLVSPGLSVVSSVQHVVVSPVLVLGKSMLETFSGKTHVEIEPRCRLLCVRTHRRAQGSFNWGAIVICCVGL
jgi:hypothetical protein